MSTLRPPDFDRIVVTDTDKCFRVMRVECNTVDDIIMLKCCQTDVVMPVPHVASVILSPTDKQTRIMYITTLTSDFHFNHVYQSVPLYTNVSLGQCCPTCSPRAACGLPAHFIWPAAVLWKKNFDRLLYLFNLGATQVPYLLNQSWTTLSLRRETPWLMNTWKIYWGQQSLSISLRSKESLQHSRVKFLTDIL